MLVALALAGAVSWTGALWLWVAPILGGAFLAATGGLLIADLKHPERFYLIFTRPQWRSWLVRGAFIIAAYAAVLMLHVVGAAAGWRTLPEALALPGVALAGLSAVYTAYLFAQAKARDLWQNPLLPLHLLLQALIAGAAALVPFAAWLDAGAVRPLLAVVAGGSALHLLLVWSESALPHATAHARLAARAMTSGRYRAPFRAGVGLGALAVAVAALVFAPGIPAAAGGTVAAALALGGLLAYEHAYVQAGQCVPLA